MNYIEITPPEREILTTNTFYNCTQNDCKSTFKNSSNLKLHLVKHHEIGNLLESNSQSKHFHCPQKNCSYYSGNSKTLNGKGVKYFSTLKYLRQHYMKVHAEKCFQCQKCNKAFSQKTYLTAHEKLCGISWICSDCGWKYNSKEALLTHCKRKTHNAVESINQSNLAVKPLNKVSRSIQTEILVRRAVKEKFCQETQTVQSKKKMSKCYQNDVKTTTSKNSLKAEYNFDESENENSNLIDNSSQTTNNLNNMSYFEDSVSCFGSNQFSIETQTDHKPLFNLDGNLENLDTIFYSNNNMYTQTCDEILSDLGLSHIQTQTNSDYNDLLVSTETQTSFQKCLLMNSSIQTQTSKSMEFLCDSLENGSNSIQTQTNH